MNWFLYNANEPLTFMSGAFWVFFLFVLTGFAILERRKAMRNAFLFAVSLFFYWKTSGSFVLILLFSTISDWWIGHRMHRTEGRQRKLWLAWSILINLSLLFYFKYAYFIADSITPMLGAQWNTNHVLGDMANRHLGTSFRIDQILLPVGISFYTFQTMSYAIDVYRKDVAPVRSLIDFGFFVSFFPQLVAGPIVRAKDFIPQIHRPYELTRSGFGLALFWILNGLLKKIWLADYVAMNLVDQVFSNPESYSGFENILSLYGYSLQVYGDFSGYTDMAIGVALLMGFKLPTNFNSPYKASNLGEFWKRWHISLSSWLKDYLYIPMGGNRNASTFTWISGGVFLLFLILLAPSFGWILIGSGALLLALALIWTFPVIQRHVSTNINLLITMMIGGLWHGASWNFVLWGGLNGAGLIFYKYWRRISPWETKDRWWKHAIGMLLTFHFITFTRIWFRTGSQVRWEDLGTPHDLWTEWFSANTMLNQILYKLSGSPFLEVIYGYRNVLLIMAAGYGIHLLPESWKGRYRDAFIKLPLAAQWIITLFVVSLAWAGTNAEMQPFIYFQF
jgi:D-alanyl-lipoteichoic acid acyltransferase DltB (MBOAT superfamily)